MVGRTIVRAQNDGRFCLHCLISLHSLFVLHPPAMQIVAAGRFDATLDAIRKKKQTVAVSGSNCQTHHYHQQ